MGMQPCEFWKLTLVEFITLYRGFVKRTIQRKNEIMSAAWHAAAFVRSRGKLPALDSLLIKQNEQKQEQTEEQMKNVAKMWTAALGGTIVE